ncbi:MAG: DNA repair protein RecO [Bryobacteraceae bacterium]
MPLKESEAIVLRSYPLGEGDRLVSFLSRTSGRLRGVARGARRPKSHFGSTLELLSHIRIWYYELETRDLVRITQSEMMESFLAAQQDYTVATGLALVSEVTEAVLPEHEAADPVFRLVLLTARNIHSGAGMWLPLAYFALWTVRLAGWLPSLETCQQCGREFGSSGAVELLTGELVCAICRGGGRPISGQALTMGRRVLAEKLDALRQSDPGEQEVKKLLELALDIVERQTERKLTTRKLLEEGM